ncbi:MAG: FISUMP domain-containing protein [Chitinophagaceae bacterium]
MKYMIHFYVLFFSLPATAQYVSAYYKDGTPKLSAAIKAEEARNRENSSEAGFNSGGSGGGTSRAFRKQVREVKADMKKASAASKKKLKSFDIVAPLIYYPGLGVGIRAVKKDNKWGFVDMSGDLVYDNLPLEYDDYRIAPSLLMAVKKEAHWGFINSNGAAMIPFEFDNVITGFNDLLSLHKGTAMVVKDGRQFEIDENGNDITAKTMVLSDSVVVTTQTGPAHWMVVNLNVNCFRNGDMIPEAKTREEWEKAGEEGKPCWCFNNYDAANGIKYGRLYNWYAVSDSRGLAPAGFHIPTDQEWLSVIDLNGGMTAGYNGLRMETGWFTPGANTLGFGALPGGARFGSSFFDPTDIACWWTATEKDKGNAVCYDLRHLHGVEKYSYNKAYGMSVRCVKD